MRRRTASLTTVVLATPVVALAAPPASADQVVGTGSFVQTAPFIDGYLLTFQCSVAAPGAASTSVDSCTLANSWYVAATAPATSSQTPVAVSDETVSVPQTTYQVCWKGTARYADGTSTTTTGCSAPSTLAGAG